MSSLTQTAKSLSLLFTQPMGTKYDVVSRLVCVLFALRTLHNVYGSVTCYGVVGSMNRFLELCWRWISPKKTPAPRIFKRVDKGMDPILNMMEQKLVRQGDAAKKNRCLPEVGWSFEEIEAELEELQNLDHTRWEDGRVSGAVYHGGSELLDMQTKAIGKFSVSNPIHPDVFPGVRKMEAEIVAMVCEQMAEPRASD